MADPSLAVAAVPADDLVAARRSAQRGTVWYGPGEDVKAPATWPRPAVIRGCSSTKVREHSAKVHRVTQPGPWVEQWLSEPRFGNYLTRAGGDQGRALALYEWNTRLSAAFMHDLAHLEVGLRNAYDRAITDHRPDDAQHWVFDADALFPPQVATADDGTEIDSNAKTREQIIGALVSAAEAERLKTNRTDRKANQPRRLGPIKPSPGHVVAEFTFGFWRYFTKSAHEKRLWVPYLHHAYPAGASRKTIDQHITKLNDLRNRVAHHEPLSLELARRRHRELIEVADWLSPELSAYISAQTTCPTHIAEPAELLLGA